MSRSKSSGPTLRFFCGKAGAGKTTASIALAQQHQAILLSEDIWMLRLYGDQLKGFEDYLRLSQQLKTVVGPLVVNLLKAGNSVVMDFQANAMNLRSWFRSVFETAHAAHVLHWLQTPDQVCLQRISMRNLARPEGSHHLTEEDFRHISSHFVAPFATEGFNVEVHGVGFR
jgi:predicted kinase